MSKAKVERNKEIIEKRFKKGKSYKEIAEHYNIDKAAVIRICNNAKKWMKLALKG